MYRDKAMQLTLGAPQMTTPNTNDKAIHAFIAAKTEIDVMLERLVALSADHFQTEPDEIDWGHVGTLNHVRARLREIINMAFNEGEHAA